MSANVRAPILKRWELTTAACLDTSRTSPAKPRRRRRPTPFPLARWTADMAAFDFLILALVLAVLALGNWPPTI